MPTTYFNPHALVTGARARGCYTCASFQGRFFAEHVLCERNGGQPLMGCAFQQRRREGKTNNATELLARAYLTADNALPAGASWLLLSRSDQMIGWVGRY